MRKDFDPLKFSEEKYGMREYKKEFPQKIGGK